MTAQRDVTLAAISKELSNVDSNQPLGSLDVVKSSTGANDTGTSA